MIAILEVLVPESFRFCKHSDAADGEVLAAMSSSPLSS